MTATQPTEQREEVISSIPSCQHCGFSIEPTGRPGRPRIVHEECKRAYYEANKADIAEKKRAYREANKADIAEKKRAYREANKADIAEKQRAYREANKADIAEKQRAYYEANKADIAEKQRAYREANKADPASKAVESEARKGVRLEDRILLACSCGRQFRDLTALGLHTQTQHLRPPTRSERTPVTS
jgi:hypothetical protein